MQEDEDGAQPAKEDPWKNFQLPFPVATFKDVNLRAYLTPHQTAEFLWARVHDHCGIRQDPTRMLKLNMNAIQQDMDTCQVPREELHYRGAEERQKISQESDPTKWKDHTAEPRCLLVLLLWLCKNRALPTQCKINALNLLVTLVQQAWEHAAGNSTPVIQAMLIGKGGRLHCQQLTFASANALCQDSWEALLSHSPATQKLWSQLSRKMWLQRCISTTVSNASLYDLLFLVTYIFAHPKLSVAGQNLFTVVAVQFIPSFIVSVGDWLQQLAIHKARERLQALPILKGKAGQARKICDPVNRLLLLFKLRKQKQHRLTIAETHNDDLGVANSRMMWFEAYVDTLLHASALESAFSDSRQICIAWDPSSYGGKDVNVAVCYDCSKKVAGYLLNQQMAHIRVSEIAGELVQFVKLTRVEGYRELKALSAAMRSINLSLMDFAVPAGLHCRPFLRDELRVKHADGAYWIFNESTGQMRPEIPEGLELKDLKIILSVADQGPNNTSALNYLMFSQQAIMLWSSADCFHRSWNDIKLSFKRSVCRAWRTILELMVLCNLAYGPYGTGQWHFKKQSKLQEFLETHTHMDAEWGEMVPLICMERKIEEPTNPEDSERLFNSLKHMENFHSKGPLIKLARWFSIFQSLSFFQGDLFATKFVIQQVDHGQAESEPDDNKPMPDNIDDYKQELNALKKRKGSWKLAPSLVTNKSVAVRDLVMTIGKACWQHHANRAQEILSPQQVAEYNVSCSAHQFWKAELVDMVSNSLWDTSCLQHLDPKFQLDAQVLTWHADLFTKLLETRSISLSIFHCLPPSLYSHLLSPDIQQSRQAHTMALKHWQILLDAEAAHNSGTEVKPLNHIQWRLSPVMRVLYMSFEQDKLLHRVGTAESSALKLQTLLTKHLGDSRMIENAHQHGRDLLRGAKTNTFSNCTIMANTLRSGALEERKANVVQPTPGMKAASATWSQASKTPLRKLLDSKSHTLPLQIQKLMQPKGKHNSWQSPAPGSLFQSVAATQWLFEFWSEDIPTDYTNVSVNDAVLSCLTCVGTFVAMRSKGLLIRVVASAEYSFLGWVASVVHQNGLPYYVCKADRGSLQWFHVHNLDDWVAIPTEPVLINFNGPVGWAKTGESWALETGACMFGLSLTATQLKALIPLLGGGKVAGNPAKRTLEERFIALVVPVDLQEQAKALLTSKQKGSVGDDEDDMDSDFSELISELGQDDANTHELKEYKKRKKELNQKRKRAAMKDELLKTKKETKRESQGKSKGKSKDRS